MIVVFYWSDFVVPLNNESYKYPVSIKGVILHQEKVLLLKNDRDEWELPGGKLELNEEPMDCLVREVFEEVGIKVKVKGIIDSWIYTIYDDLHVLIITYGCYEVKNDFYRISNEHSAGKWFSLKELEDLRILQGYLNSIKNWYRKLNLYGQH